MNKAIRRMAQRPHGYGRRATLTPPMTRIHAKLGFLPMDREIAEGAGVRRDEAGFVLHGLRFTRRVQEAVAHWAGLTVAELFGREAWNVRAKAAAKATRKASAA